MHTHTMRVGEGRGIRLAYRLWAGLSVREAENAIIAQSTRLGVSVVPVQRWRPRRCLDCLVHEAGCLSDPSAALTSKKMPGLLGA